MLASIKTINELKNMIVPLTREEYAQLEANILLEGCREPLLAWKNEQKESILIDGHNRFKICKKHAIPFKVKFLQFENLDEVKHWMVRNQLGRRNLTPDQVSFYRGLQYENLKKKKGGYARVQSKGQNEPLTSTQLAEIFNTSESTIKRDAKFAKGLSLIGKLNPQLKNKILSGEAKIKKMDIMLFANVEEGKIPELKNEADLYNKASIIRNEILSDIEHRFVKEKEERLNKALVELNSHEPIFLDANERINRIKGDILSAMNKAIKNRNADAINELKVLVEKLEILLL